MAAILLNEKFFRETMPGSDNIAGKYLQAAFREAQNRHYRNIVGDVMLRKLCTIVEDGTVTDAGNAAYKSLIDESQYYLAYSSMVTLLPKLAYKIGNFGVASSTDQGLQTAPKGERDSLISDYEAEMDRCALDLQDYILNNREDLPEIDETRSYAIRSNLYSAASCGVYLGGARGKGLFVRRCNAIRERR